MYTPNPIVLHFILVFFMRKKEKSYAKKSISKNGICILNCCNYCTCLCIFQSVCGKRTDTNEYYQKKQRSKCYPCSRRGIYVWKDVSNLVSCSCEILLCLCIRNPGRKSGSLITVCFYRFEYFLFYHINLVSTLVSLNVQYITHLIPLFSTPGRLSNSIITKSHLLIHLNLGL